MGDNHTTIISRDVTEMTKLRWIPLKELPPESSGLFKSHLMAWLPPKYQQLPAPDVQTSAAFDPALRAELMNTVKEIAAKFTQEVQQDKTLSDEDRELYLTCIKTQTEKNLDGIDPSRHVTADSISRTTDLETLRQMADSVYKYNGDERMLLIYNKVAQLTNDTEAQALLKGMSDTWRKLEPTPVSAR